MNSRRLARLMGIICDIKAHPRRSPEEVCRRFRISRRQLYKDRDSLAGMGISFHHSHKTGGFVLDREPTFNISGMSLADLFALVLAVRQLTRVNDFALAMGALAGLRTLVGQLPEGLRPLFEEALDQVVIADGFGCAPEVLHALLPAIAEARRVVLVMDSLAEEEQRVSVDPKRLLLREGALFLEALGLEAGGLGLVALSRVRRVIATPFFSPPR
jgi:predicted DNA-binding transcriptional regulator YafY